MIFSLPILGKFRLERADRNYPEIDLHDLYQLESSILDEVVREGEQRILAQTSSHISTDQRGFTIAGLQLTVATTSLAAYFSIVSGTSKIGLSGYAFALGAGMFILAFISLLSVWPKRFGLPGNEPENWLPNNWKYQKRTLKWGKVEQAECLQLHIQLNREVGRKKAYRQMFSIISSFLLVFTLATIFVVNKLSVPKCQRFTVASTHNVHSPSTSKAPKVARTPTCRPSGAFPGSEGV